MANGLIKPIEFFYDLSFTNMNDLNFVSFLIDQSNNNAYVIVDSKKHITTVSEMFYNMLGLKSNRKLTKTQRSYVASN